MRFQNSKNTPKFAFEHGGFSQRQSHLIPILVSVFASKPANVVIKSCIYAKECFICTSIWLHMIELTVANVDDRHF